MPWAAQHSVRVKAFRELQGLKAKTDPIDARLLQAFGRHRLQAGQLRLGRIEDIVLEALMARQRQIKDALHAEQCRSETAAIAPVRASIARLIAQLESELAAITTELTAHEACNPLLALKQAVMCERKGVAQATARALVAALPEIGRLDRREIASLSGMAPRVHKSGRTDRRRSLTHGRRSVKVILFNPARTAMQWDPEIKAFCARLRARGKPGKVIMGCGHAQTSGAAQCGCSRCPRGEGARRHAACGSLIHRHGGRLRHRARLVKAGRRPPPKAAQSGLDPQA